MPLFLYFALIQTALSFYPRFQVELEVTSNLVSIGQQQVGMTQDGRSIFVWSDLDVSSNSGKVFAQFYDSSGYKSGSEITVSSTDVFLRQNPSISVQKDGSFVVVWESVSQDGDGIGIFAQIFNNQAKKINGEIQLNNISSGDQYSPSVSMMNDFFAVAWVGPDPDGTGIYGNFFDISGNRLEDQEFLLNFNTYNDQILPVISIIHQASNVSFFLGFIVAWSSAMQNDSDSDVMGRFFYFTSISQNHLSSDEFLINTYTGDLQTNPYIALEVTVNNSIVNSFFLADIVVVWQSYGQEHQFGIFAQIFLANISKTTSNYYNLSLTTIGQEFQVNSFIDDDQINAAVGYTQNNNFIVVWQSNQQDGDGWGIFSQEFTNNGTKFGLEIQINKFTLGNQELPYISLNSNGDFVVAWLSAAMSQQGISMNMQTFSSNSISYVRDIQGTEIYIGAASNKVKPVVEIFNIYSYFCSIWCDDKVYGKCFNSENELIYEILIDTSNATNPSISATSDDLYFIIVWENSFTKDIYAQYFYANTPQSNVIKLNSVSNGENPSVKCSENAYCLIVWNSVDKNIYAQYLTNKKTLGYTNEIQINSATENDQYYPQISVASDGGIIIIWVSNVKLSTNQTAISIVGRWFITDSLGIYPYQNDFTIYNSTNFYECHPSVATLSSGHFVVVWHDTGFDGSGSAVLGQVWTRYWSRFGHTDFQINTYVKNDQKDPYIVMNDNIFVVCWSSFLQDSDNFGIYGQMFDRTGNKIDKEFRVNTFFYGQQAYSHSILGKKGNLIIVWLSADSNEGQSYHIAAQRYTIMQLTNAGRQRVIGFKDLVLIGQTLAIGSEMSNDGNYAYILQDDGYLLITDFNDNFRTVSEVFVGTSSTVGFCKYGEFLYVGSSNNESILSIFNASNSNSLVRIEHNTSFPNIYYNETLRKMKIFNGELYLQFSINFYIFNLSDPINPRFVVRLANDINLNFTNILDFELNNDINTLFIITKDSKFYGFLRSELEKTNFISRWFISYPENINTVKFSSDGKFFFFGTDTGFKILQNLGEATLKLIKTLYLSAVLDIEVSYDSNYIVVCTLNHLYTFDISNIESPYQLRYEKFNGYLTSSSFLNLSMVFIHGELGTFVLKLVSVDPNNLTPTLTLLGQQILQDASSFDVSTSPSGNFLYTSDRSRNINILDISNPKGCSLPNVLPNSTNFNFNTTPFFVYLFNSSGFQIYQVSNEVQVTPLGHFDMPYLSDNSLSSDGNLMYVLGQDSVGKSTLLILNVTNFSKPVVFSQYTFKFSMNGSLTLSEDENWIFISFQTEGVYVLNSTDKTNLTLIYTLKLNDVTFNFIDSIQTDELYIITCTSERILFYFWDSSNYTLVYLSKISVKDTIFDLQTLNENYLLALGVQTLFLINIENKQSPVFISQITLRNTYVNGNIAFSNDFKYVFLPSVETIGLYSGTLDVYLDLTFSTINTQKTYTFSLYPYDIGSLNSTDQTIRVLDSSSHSANWINLDASSMIMTMTPSSKQDFVGLQQPYYLVYSIPIQDQVITIEELNELRTAIYIDNDNYVTSYFDPALGIESHNPNISKSRLNFILQQHFFVRTVYFSLPNFLEITPKPVKLLSLQKQFDEINNVQWITIDQRMDFPFSANTFIDLDGTPLIFTATNLPVWLLFDQSNLRFSGTPTIRDRNNYTIAVIASNGFQEVNDSFLIYVDYKPPFVNPNNTMQSQLRADPVVNEPFSMTFRANTFIDPNNDTITFYGTLDNGPLPAWVSFDSVNLIFELKPTQEEIFKTFKFGINATNRYFYSFDTLKFKIQASWQFILTWLAQILGPIVSIIGLYKYRVMIFNNCCKKMYHYPEENIALVEHCFEKEFFLIKEDLAVARLIWHQLKTTKKLKQIISSENSTLLSGELAEAVSKIKGKMKSLHIEGESIAVKGTIFVIIEMFIIHQIMNKNKYIRYIYQRIKNPLMKAHGNTWYFELAGLEKDSKRNRKVQKFPSLQIKKKALEEKCITIINEIELKKMMKKVPKETLEKVLIVIEKRIKADTLGIPNYDKQIFEYSQGESLLINSTEISEIKAEKKIDEKFVKIESSGNRKLPLWLDYKIENGILEFYGVPHHTHISQYKIIVLNENEMKLRTFLINVILKKDEILTTQIKSNLVTNVLENLDEKSRLNILEISMRE